MGSVKNKIRTPPPKMYGRWGSRKKKCWDSPKIVHREGSDSACNGGRKIIYGGRVSQKKKYGWGWVNQIFHCAPSGSRNWVNSNYYSNPTRFLPNRMWKKTEKICQCLLVKLFDILPLSFCIFSDFRCAVILESAFGTKQMDSSFLIHRTLYEPWGLRNQHFYLFPISSRIISCFLKLMRNILTNRGACGLRLNQIKKSRREKQRTGSLC